MSNGLRQLSEVRAPGFALTNYLLGSSRSSAWERFDRRHPLDGLGRDSSVPVSIPTRVGYVNLPQLDMGVNRWHADAQGVGGFLVE